MKMDVNKLDSSMLFILKKHRGLEIEDIEKIQTPEELFDIWCEWGELLGSGFGPRITFKRCKSYCKRIIMNTSEEYAVYDWYGGSRVIQANSFKKAVEEWDKLGICRDENDDFDEVSLTLINSKKEEKHFRLFRYKEKTEIYMLLEGEQND